jgi:peptide/nickel transport system permease protein
MLRLVLTRIAIAILTLWLLSAIVFAATQLLPGDVASAVLGRDATPDALASLRSQLGLDHSVPAQFVRWQERLLHGHLGDSLAATASIDRTNATVAGVPVWDLIGTPFRNTFILTAIATVLLVPLSLLLGLWTAVKRDRTPDRIVSGLTLVLISLPEFVVATFLILLLAVAFPLLPSVSIIDQQQPLTAQLDLFVLPVLTLLAAILAQTTRMVRAGVAEVLSSDYVEMARMKGLPEKTVIRRYVLPNALAPTIQVFAINLAWLVGGIVVVEAVFQFPGVGLALRDAVTTRDLPVIQAITLIVAVFYVGLNLVSDLATTLLTPKLRMRS